MKKWTRKMKRIMAFMLTLVLMGANMNMTVLATGTVSGGDAGMTVSAADAQDSVSGGNAGEGGGATVSGGDGDFAEVRTEDELRTAVENGKSVKLMADISLTDTVIISDSLTVDLNGQSVKGAEDKSVFTVTGSGAEVIFTDSGADGTGMVTAVGDVDTPAAVRVENEASVVIEEGTYAGGYAPLIVEEDGSATVNGGTFDGEDAYWAAVNFGGSLTISAGTFQKDGSYIIHALSGTTTLTGGSFVTTDQGLSSAAIDYRGGTLDLSNFMESGLDFYFGAAPQENQVRIPEGYVWFAENTMVNEINEEDWLTLVKPIKVSFDANGGTGTMAPEYAMEGEYRLPACEFTSPEGLSFRGWATTADGKAMNSYYPVTGDITFYAIWEKSYDVYVGSVGMADGDYLANNATEVSSTKPATGGYAYYKDGVLTLNNYVYSGEGYWYDVGNNWEYSCVLLAEDLKLKLEGENQLKNTSSGSDGIILTGDLVVSGTGSLELKADYYGINCDTFYDEVLGDYVGGNLMIQSGTLSIDADDAMDIAGNLTMDNGQLVINSYYGAVEVNGDVTINGGTVELISSEYEGFYVDGEITVIGGYVYVDAYSGAMYAEDGITIDEDVVEIIYPDNGSVSYDESMGMSYIADASGAPAVKVIIAPPVEHSWSVDYDYNHEAHWHSCTDADCFLTKDSSMYAEMDGSAYALHDANGAGGVCSVCGYNTNKEVGIYVGDLGLADGEYLTNEGRISTTKPATGGYAYYKDGVLTLKDYVYEGTGHEYEENDYVYSAAVYSELEEMKLVLQGESRLTSTLADGDGIYCAGSLSIEGDGLVIEANGDGIDINGNLVVNSGTIMITTSDDDGIDVDEEASITINGGTFTINADDNGIDSMGDLIVNGGILNITSDTDDCTDMEGGILIKGGTVTLKADDDGLSAYGDILIEGGTITVEAGDYAILSYGDTEITGGYITLVSDMDITKEKVPAIKVAGELTLGEQVELLLPKNGTIGTLEEESGTEGVYEYYQIIADADGKTATYVVIKGAQSEEPTPTPTPGGSTSGGSTSDGTATPAPTQKPGTSAPTQDSKDDGDKVYKSPQTGESSLLYLYMLGMMATVVAGGSMIVRKKKVNK